MKSFLKNTRKKKGKEVVVGGGIGKKGEKKININNRKTI